MSPKPQENIPVVHAGAEDADEQNRKIETLAGGFINVAFEKDENAAQCSSSADATIATITPTSCEINLQQIPNKLELANDLKKEASALPPQQPLKIMDFDDLLPHVGEFGRYQKILFLLMIPFAFFVAFVYFSQIFITLVPEDHWCHVPELMNLTIDERMALSVPDFGKADSSYSKCSMYDVNYTEVLSQGIKTADPSWPIVACQHGWDFNFTDVPYSTVATELEWVCDHSYLPTLSQSIFFLGAIVGGLLFGWIADRFGRIPALAGCNIIGFFAGVATAFVGSFWTFSLCRFLVGFAFDNCFTMMYILVLEYVGPKWRTFVANMSIALFFTTATCLLPWIAYYLADWKTFAIVTSAPLLLAVFTPWCVPESARWLVSQGKVEQAITIMKKFERINKKTVAPQIYKDFSDSCARLQAEEEANNTYSVLDLFKTPRLRNISILLIVIWMAISLVFDGHVRNVGSLGLDLFFTFTVAAATELPADTFLTLTLDRWGRRWLACGTMVASGVFSLLATTVPLGPYSATLAILGRFSVNISYNIGLQYAAELLPTVVRAQGVAFIHIMGYVASILAPFVVYLANISPSLPLIVLGILGIFGGLLSLFLPETLGHELPQTLADGENFGRGQGMWDFPCMRKKIDDDEKESDDKVGQFTRSTPSMRSTGASLRASTRGELRSSILQRSIRSRKSYRTINEV